MAALGLLLLVAAGVFAVAVAFGNIGHHHAVSDFGFLGWHTSSLSATDVFLLGVVACAAGLLGLAMVMAGLKRAGSRWSTRRHEAKTQRMHDKELADERKHLSQELENERKAREAAEARAAAEARNARLTKQAPASNGMRPTAAPMPPAPTNAQPMTQQPMTQQPMTQQPMGQQPMGQSGGYPADSAVYPNDPAREPSWRDRISGKHRQG